MTKRINKILWNGTEVPQSATRADGLDGLNLGELFIKNDPQEPGIYTRTTDGKVVLLGGGGSGTSELVDWNSIVNKPTKVSYFINDAGYATTSDLDTRIDALVNGAPAAYDTLKEIADVLANNINSIDDILTALGTKANKVDVDAAIANVNSSISALNTELSGKIDLKLDAVTFNELFEKVQLEDGTWAIKAKLGLFSDGFISAKGSNVGGTSSEGGAVALYQLNDVLANGTSVSGAVDGAVFVYDGKLGKWKGMSQSAIVPNLTGYATESWVLQQGFLTEHQDLSAYAKLTDIPTIPTTDINKGVTAYGWGDHSKVGYLTGITSALVTGALGYTPYDAANFTKAAIKSTLGISDWALESSKPSYKFSEITDKPTTIGGFGITDAYTKSQVDSALGGYLPLSGGTLTNTLTIQRSPSVICFTSSSGSLLGYLGFGGDNTPIMYENDGATRNILIHSGNYTDYTYSKTSIDSKLGGYLPLSGGTLYNGVDNAPLTIKGTTTDAYVRFALNNDRFLGALGINKTLGLVLWDVANLQNRVIIHSGNIGSQSVASAKKLSSLGNPSTDTFADYVNAYNGVTLLVNTSGASVGNIGSTNWVLNIGNSTSRYGRFIMSLSTSSDELFWQSGNSSKNGWGTLRKIAFTDSNVASATKLQTARSIWGQSFDGTGDVSGNLILGYNKIYLVDGSNSYYVGWNSNSQLEIKNYYDIIFNTSTERMRITKGGNVGIGTTIPQYKLDVNGTLHASDVVTLDKELIGNGWKISKHRSSNLLLFGLELHGSNEVFGEIAYYQDHFIVGNFRNGTENAIINFYDNGNVTIDPAACCGVCMRNPQYALDVNGVIHSNTGIFSDGYVSAKGQNTSSDMRLKNVLNDVVLNVSDIANAPSMRFSWKNGGGVDVGSSAQYWQGLLPDAVKERDGMLEMQYANIALLSAIALAKNFETIDERVARLEKENEELKTKIDMMERGIA